MSRDIAIRKLNQLADDLLDLSDINSIYIDVEPDFIRWHQIAVLLRYRRMLLLYL